MNKLLTEILFYDTAKNRFVVEEKNQNYLKELNNADWHGRNPPQKKEAFYLEKEIKDFHELDFGENKTIVLAKRYSPHNAAHLFIETAIPIENKFNFFNIPNENRVIIFNDYCFDDSIFWFEGDGDTRRNMAKKHSRAHLSPMGEVIYNFKQFASNQSEKRYLKFKNNILFGIGGVSPWVCGSHWNDRDIGPVLDSLVEKIYNYHDVSPKEQDTLTFLYKHGRRSIINYEEVGELLQKKAVNAGLRYECANLEKINIKQQLQILSRTKIFVSVGGSTSFSSFLIPHKKIKFLYFPLKDNIFESHLFRRFHDRFDFEDYSNLKPQWGGDIQRKDGSFLVDLSKLNKFNF